LDRVAFTAGGGGTTVGTSVIDDHTTDGRHDRKPPAGETHNAGEIQRWTADIATRISPTEYEILANGYEIIGGIVAVEGLSIVVGKGIQIGEATPGIHTGNRKEGRKERTKGRK